MFASSISREFALAQAAIEHGAYFLEIGAEQRAAAYFQFASDHLKQMAYQLVLGSVSEAQSKKLRSAQPDRHSPST